MKSSISFLGIFIFSLSFAQQKWSLQQCVDYSVQNNLSINQSRIQQQLTENDQQFTKNQWLPSVSGYFNNSLTLGTNHPAINKGYEQFTNSMGVGSSITLYNGGLIGLNNEKAQLNTDSSKFQTDKKINDISLMVVNYYLNVMLNRELLQIANSNMEISQQQLDRSQKLFNGGKIAKAELVQAEANLAQEKKTVADSKIEVDRALFNLSVLLQLNDYRNFDIEGIQLPDELMMQLYDLDVVTQTAYSNQPEIKKSEIDLQMAEKDIEIAKTGFKPTISGTYNLGTSYSAYFNKGLTTNAWLSQWYDNITNVIGVNVSIPIFEKHNNKLNVQKAQINQSMAQNLMDQQKQTIRENVQAAYFDASSSFEAYEAAKESVRSNELSADFAQKSFDAGALNLYDLNIARNNLVVSKSQLAQAKYNFVFRMKVLDFYAGVPLTAGLEQ